MEFITGRHLPRRTFLRAAGMATVGLPFLDAMAPAGRLWAQTMAELNRTRLICIENSHGAAGSNVWGITQNLWSPAAVGGDFDLSPSALSPLEPFRDYLTIVSNTDVRMAEPSRPEEVGGDHFRSTAVFLTQAHPKQTKGSDVFAGTSLDQIQAQRYGQDTPLPSIQLCIEDADAGGCWWGYTCAYTDSLSWASPTQPLPAIRSPRVAFEQLFGAGGTPEGRADRLHRQASILDWMVEKVKRLSSELGPTDRLRMDEYLNNIREVERRIELTEARNTSGEEREIPEAPAGIPDSFEEHVKLMFDLQVLALESDTTRVITFKMARDNLNRVYPGSDTNQAFHPLSHHGGNPERIRQFNVINRYHVSMLPYLLQKLENSMEGDKSLLEKSAIIYGSPMADGNLHNHRRCPLIVLGHANGKLSGGLHLMAPEGTPMANAMLSLLHKLGHDEMESFGNSTGAFSLAG